MSPPPPPPKKAICASLIAQEPPSSLHKGVVSIHSRSDATCWPKNGEKAISPSSPSLSTHHHSGGVHSSSTSSSAYSSISSPSRSKSSASSSECDPASPGTRKAEPGASPSVHKSPRSLYTAHSKTAEPQKAKSQTQATPLHLFEPISPASGPSEDPKEEETELPKETRCGYVNVIVKAKPPTQQQQMAPSSDAQKSPDAQNPLVTLQLERLFVDDHLQSAWEKCQYIDLFLYSAVDSASFPPLRRLIPAHRVLLSAYSEVVRAFTSAYPEPVKFVQLLQEFISEKKKNATSSASSASNEPQTCGQISELNLKAIALSTTPVLALDLPLSDLNDLVELMYKGKVTVAKTRLESIQKSADKLKMCSITIAGTKQSLSEATKECDSSQAERTEKSGKASAAEDSAFDLEPSPYSSLDSSTVSIDGGSQSGSEEIVVIGPEEEEEDEGGDKEPKGPHRASPGGFFGKRSSKSPESSATFKRTLETFLRNTSEPSTPSPGHVAPPALHIPKMSKLDESIINRAFELNSANQRAAPGAEQLLFGNKAIYHTLSRSLSANEMDRHHAHAHAHAQQLQHHQNRQQHFNHQHFFPQNHHAHHRPLLPSHSQLINDALRNAHNHQKAAQNQQNQHQHQNHPFTAIPATPSPSTPLISPFASAFPGGFLPASLLTPPLDSPSMEGLIKPFLPRGSPQASPNHKQQQLQLTPPLNSPPTSASTTHSLGSPFNFSGLSGLKSPFELGANPFSFLSQFSAPNGAGNEGHSGASLFQRQFSAPAGLQSFNSSGPGHALPGERPSPLLFSHTSPLAEFMKSRRGRKPATVVASEPSSPGGGGLSPFFDPDLESGPLSETSHQCGANGWATTPGSGANCRKRCQNLYHAAKYRDRRRHRMEQLYGEKEALEKAQSLYLGKIDSLKAQIVHLISQRTHAVTRDGLQIFQCPVCRAVFPQLEGIRVHLSKDHAESLKRLSPGTLASGREQSEEISRQLQNLAKDWIAQNGGKVAAVPGSTEASKGPGAVPIGANKGSPQGLFNARQMLQFT